MPAIRALRERPIVIVLTARDQVTDRIRGLDAGADDYLIKPYDPGELLARLRAVRAPRAARSDAPVLQLGSLQIDLARDLVRKRRRAGRADAEGMGAAARDGDAARAHPHARDAAGCALRLRATRPTATRSRSSSAACAASSAASHIQTLRGLGYRLAFSPDDAGLMPAPRASHARLLADRLTRTLIVWVGGVWLACVLGVTWYVDREINHNFDNEMIESAHRMVDIAVHELDRERARRARRGARCR